MKHISLILFVLIISSCRNRTDRDISKSKTNIIIFYSIKKFVDGDTFWVKDGSLKGIKIRLIGIDTPENQARFGNPEEYYGDEASSYVKKILHGKKVKLEFDKDSLDSFGRTLAYVYLENGTFLNDQLVKEGYAKVMTIKPNTKYVNRFIQSEKFAINKKIGLWKKH